MEVREGVIVFGKIGMAQMPRVAMTAHEHWKSWEHRHRLQRMHMNIEHISMDHKPMLHEQ